VVSLTPSSTGSEQDLSRPLDTLRHQPSLPFLSSFDSLRLTNDSRLSDDGAIAYNGSSDYSSMSSYGVPSPDLPSPQFSNSSWVDGCHSSMSNSPDPQHLGNLHSPTSPFLYSNGSDELRGNIIPNRSSGSPSSYHSVASSFDHPYSEGSIPHSPLETNNSAGLHSSSENFCLPPSLLHSRPEQFPLPQSPEPEPRHYPNFPIEPETIPYSDPRSPAREYPSPFEGPSQPDSFVQGSSSQAQYTDVFSELGDLFEGQQRDNISSALEAEHDDSQCDKERVDRGCLKVLKPQVSSLAGFAASENKRRNPHRWICSFCKRGFTRKNSHVGEYKYLFFRFFLLLTTV
jgi:hypothetical protein